MTWTLEYLDELEEAIALGATRFQHEDKTITFRSLNDMMRTRRLIRRSLGLDPKGPRRIGSYYSKGLLPDGPEPGRCDLG